MEGGRGGGREESGRERIRSYKGRDIIGYKRRERDRRGRRKESMREEGDVKGKEKGRLVRRKR